MKAAIPILDRIEMDPALKSTLLLSLAEGKAERFPRNEDFIVPPDSLWEPMSHWYFYAVLSLSELSSFRCQPKWIAKRLGIRPEEAQGALDVAIQQGLIVKQGAGWTASGKQLRAPGTFPASSLKAVHRQYMEKAVASLSYPPEMRDISGMTFAIDMARLPEAIRRIRDFRRTLATYLAGGKRLDSVYRLNIQLFSLLEPEAPPRKQ
jgi:uncharacterized protein (TIGR02147 family)